MSSLRKIFNQSAATYNAHAKIQKIIAGRLAERLSIITIKPEKILDLGGGTGFLSEKLGVCYPNSMLIAVDFAEEMLAHNRAQNLVCADALALPFTDGKINLIASNLMMQWCSDLKKLLDECHRVLKKNGLFIFSTLGPDTLLEMRKSWAVADDKKHINDFSDLHDIGDQLLQNGFSGAVVEMEKLTMTYEKVVDIIRDLKAVGAAQIIGGSKSLTGKNAFSTMVAAYENYREAGKLPATYEVIYGHAWKNEAAENIDITTKFSTKYE